MSTEQANYSRAWDRLFALLPDDLKEALLLAPSGDLSAELGLAATETAEADAREAAIECVTKLGTFTSYTDKDDRRRSFFDSCGPSDGAIK